VVNVGVGADDGLDLKLVSAEEAEDAFHFVAGVNNDGFVSLRIANDRAVALKHANRELEINHLRVSRVGQAVRWVNVIHGKSIPSAIGGIIVVVSGRF
jgi:hypothetical protein